MASTAEEPPTSPSPSLDLESSFYGPGSLTCWYLSLLCVLITWTFHPTKNFLRLSISPDVVFFALYAILASYHMAVQITYFSPVDIAHLNEVFSPVGETPEREILGKFSEGLQKQIMSMTAAVDVGVIYLWLGLYALVGVLFVTNDKVRPRRRRKLPWVLFLSELWVFSCFCFLASRCGLGNVLTAFFLYSINICSELVVVCLIEIIFVFWVALCADYICGLLSNFRYNTPEILANARNLSRSLTFLSFVKLLLSYLAMSLAFALLSVIILGFGAYMIPVLMREMLIGTWFPDLGVKMSALDQILGLCTGLMAVIFTVCHAFEGQHGRQKLARVKAWVQGFIASDDFFYGSVGRMIHRIGWLLRRARTRRDVEMQDRQHLQPNDGSDENSDGDLELG